MTSTMDFGASLERRLEIDSLRLSLLVASVDDDAQVTQQFKPSAPLAHFAAGWLVDAAQQQSEKERLEAELDEVRRQLANERKLTRHAQESLKECTCNKDTTNILEDTNNKLQESEKRCAALAEKLASLEAETALSAETETASEGLNASSDATTVAELEATVAAQAATIAEWKETVAKYHSWHDRVLAATVAKHETALVERDQRFEAVQAQAEALRAELEQYNAQETTNVHAEQEGEHTEMVLSPSSASRQELVKAQQREGGVVGLREAYAVRFPRPLAADSGASVKEHIGNLFGQVDALKAQLACLGRRRQEASAQRLASETRQRLESGENVMQHIHSATQHSACIETHPEDESKQTMVFNAATQSLVQTSSLSGSNDPDVGAIFTTLSQQFSVMSASSDSFNEFVASIAKQIAEHHSQIHRLQAQVEHAQEKEKTSHNDKAEVQRLIQAFLERMTSIGQVIQVERSSAEGGAEFVAPSSFFLSLQSFIDLLLEQQSNLSTSLSASMDSYSVLQSLFDEEKLRSSQWREEVGEHHRLADDIETLKKDVEANRSMIQEETGCQTDDLELPSLNTEGFSSSSHISIPRLPLFEVGLIPRETADASTDIADGDLSEEEEEEEEESKSAQRTRRTRKATRPAPVVAPKSQKPPSAYDIHMARAKAERELRMGPRWIFDTRVQGAAVVDPTLPRTITNGRWERQLRKPENCVIVPRM